MGQVTSKEGSKPQPTAAAMQIPNDIHDKNLLSPIIPLENMQENPTITSQQPEAPNKHHDNTMESQVVDTVKGESLINKSDYSKSSQSVAVICDGTVLVERFAAPEGKPGEVISVAGSPQQATQEAAANTDTLDEKGNNTIITSPLAELHGDVADVQGTAPIRPSSPVTETKSMPALSPKDKALSPTILHQLEVKEVTADVSAIATELLKPSVSPISPTMTENTFQFNFVQADSPVERFDVDANADETIRSPLRLLSSSVEIEDTIQFGTTTPTKPNVEDSPEPVDMTTDVTADFTNQFDDDKDRLKAFILRTKQEKANKAATITRRESFQNRRDSDAVRRALASPRPALEEKDTNISSPTRETSFQNISRVLESVISDVEDQDATLSLDSQAPADNLIGSPSLRRSTRKQSRIPQLPTAAAASRTPKKIAVRRTDGTDTVVLTQKKEAQELAQLTRTNTRKNKGAAVSAQTRIVQMTAESLATFAPGAAAAAQPSASPNTSAPRAEPAAAAAPADRRKSVHWDDARLTSFQAAAPAPDDAKPAGALAPAQAKKGGSGASRVRRLRGLGAANGTPAKGLLAATLLPDEVAEQKEAAVVPRDGPRRADDTRSRIAAPKKLELKPSVACVAGLALPDGKENAAGRFLSPKTAVVGLAGKGMIPVPASTLTAAAVKEAWEKQDGSIGAAPARKRVRKV